MKQLHSFSCRCFFFAAEREHHALSPLSVISPVVNVRDPVQHARCEIYKKYGVPVYFNDTWPFTAAQLHADGIARYETTSISLDAFGYGRGWSIATTICAPPKKEGNCAPCVLSTPIWARSAARCVPSRSWWPTPHRFVGQQGRKTDPTASVSAP